MTTAIDEPRLGGRGAAAISLVVLNLALLTLNLDKQDVLPFSTGLFSSDSTGAAVEVLEGDDSGLSPTTLPTNESGVTLDTVAPDNLVAEEATAPVDDWPGGRGPAPAGPPLRRQATIEPDGRLTLTGSSPDWATATRIVNLAGASIPGGVDVVDNQLTWHPDASPDIRSGDVVIEQAATFNLGNAVIEQASFPTLDLAADLLKSRPSLFVVVIGHTDNVGDDALNAELALERANAVVSYLIDQGVVPAQIVVASAGEDDPTASNETVEGRNENRRIELQFKNFLIPPEDFGSVGG